MQSLRKNYYLVKKVAIKGESKKEAAIKARLLGRVDGRLFSVDLFTLECYDVLKRKI